MRQLSTTITRSICDQIITSPMQWTAATNLPETATHAVDFGLGGLSGIGPLTARNLDGRGARIIVVGDKGKGDAELYDPQNILYEEWWSEKWGPKLVSTRYANSKFFWKHVLIACYSSDGTIHIDTPYSRLLGKPPIMVAGMTPSTVKGGFVSAVLSAGFHVELAGGGHYSSEAHRAKVTEIQSKIPPGVGITLSSLYINPGQFGFRLPL
jgi:fatty acid synthase subunit alpha